MLNTRCRIEQKSVTQDADLGTEVITWALLAVVWCNVQDVLTSRAESVKSALDVSANPTRVRMRYRSDIDASMRLVIARPAATIYQIVAGPVELGQKDGIELMVVRYSTQGA